jgi:putative membrane protein
VGVTELLGEAERGALVAAVEAAESASGAEIVPVLVAASGDYPVADARGTAVGALVGALAYLAAPALAGAGLDPAWLGALAVAAGALGGLVLARVARIRRALAGSELDERVDLAAARTFLERNVFRTAERTGILLFVSLFERQVRVIADEGVYRAVERPIWERLAATVATEMRDDRPGAALLRAIEATAALVVEHGPRRRADDVNELPDAPATNG